MYKVSGEPVDSRTGSVIPMLAITQLPNVSPQTGERDKAVPFKALMKFRTGLDPTYKLKPCVGCNGVPAGDGVITVGNWVYIKKMI